jgi:hypothetical protein
MNASLALRKARVAGVEVSLDGDSLLLQAASEPPADVLKALARHKGEILLLLRCREPEWTREERQASFDERAGIVQFDGGFSRADAELCAFEDCIDHWLTLHPPAAPEVDTCAQCRAPVTDAISISLAEGGQLHEHCAGRWKVWDVSTLVGSRAGCLSRSRAEVGGTVGWRETR